MVICFIKLNGLEERVEIINEDIKYIDKVLDINGYYVVILNFLYMYIDGIKNLNDKKVILRYEVRCNLEDVIRVVFRLVMFRGKFFMIYRLIRLVDIIILGRKYKLELKVI